MSTFVENVKGTGFEVSVGTLCNRTGKYKTRSAGSASGKRSVSPSGSRTAISFLEEFEQKYSTECDRALFGVP